MKNKIPFLSIAVGLAFFFNVSLTQAFFNNTEWAITAKKRAEQIKKDQEERMQKISEEREEKANERICSRIEGIISRIEQRASRREENFLNAQENKENNLETRQNNTNNDIEKRRAERDELRNDYYEKLEAKASSDAQKEAVENFQAAIEAAVTERRAAIDTAVEIFRQAVEEAISERKSSVTNLVSELESTEKAAAEKAKSACEEGADSKEVLQVFRSDLQAARDNFKNNRNEIEKVGDAVKILSETKNQSIKEAIESFESAVEIAKEDLKEAFEI